MKTQLKLSPKTGFPDRYSVTACAVVAVLAHHGGEWRCNEDTWNLEDEVADLLNVTKSARSREVRPNRTAWTVHLTSHERFSADAASDG